MYLRSYSTRYYAGKLTHIIHILLHTYSTGHASVYKIMRVAL